MFNDLNNSGSQNHQVVDDIFAETDKAQGNASVSPLNPSKASVGAEINTQKIGLTSDDFNNIAADKKGKDKMFKIIITAIAVIVLGLGSYLVYTKFLMAPASTEKANVVVKEETPSTQTSETPSGSFVETKTTNSVATSTMETPLIPGVNTSATSTANMASSTAVTSNVDSDTDGLSDAEEQIAGTNINIIDTDNDGLSDYEEVKIYKSNPLSADTDGDSYLDGAEVKGGYDPNLVGAKLSGGAPASKTVPEVK